MSAEIENFKPGSGPAKPGKRCRYCARLTVEVPTAPDEAERHCESKGCPWCKECHEGKTEVSPVKGKDEAA